MSNNISPLCMPPKGIGLYGSENGERYVLQRTTIAKFQPGSGATGAQTVYFNVQNPSPRLRCMISVAFEFSNGQDFAGGATTPVWRLDGIRRSREASLPANLDNIFTGRSLPDAYEMETALKEVRGTLTLTDTDLATGLTCAVVVEATWEPANYIDRDVDRLLLLGVLKAALPGGQPLSIRNTT